MNYFQRTRCLAGYQDSLTVGKEVAYQVGNGVAFPGARWPLYENSWPSIESAEYVPLLVVGWQGEQHFIWDGPLGKMVSMLIPPIVLVVSTNLTNALRNINAILKLSQRLLQRGV